MPVSVKIIKQVENGDNLGIIWFIQQRLFGCAYSHPCTGSPDEPGGGILIIRKHYG
jgi:hypothetical protein